MALPTTKQHARALIDGLPETADWNEILYAIELAADLERGIRDADAGRTVDTATARQQLGLKD